MALTQDIQKYISRSVLCWLASVSVDGVPNVSPKEIFNHHNDKIIIANIASPNSVRNIKSNEKVCVSFIDVLVQKGYQLKGNAKVINRDNEFYLEYESKLIEMTGGGFPFSTITEISVTNVKSIVSPRYLLYPETTEQEQIDSARVLYNLKNSIS